MASHAPSDAGQPCADQSAMPPTPRSCASCSLAAMDRLSSNQPCCRTCAGGPPPPPPLMLEPNLQSKNGVAAFASQPSTQPGPAAAAIMTELPLLRLQSVAQEQLPCDGGDAPSQSYSRPYRGRPRRSDVAVDAQTTELNVSSNVSKCNEKQLKRNCLGVDSRPSHEQHHYLDITCGSPSLISFSSPSVSGGWCTPEEPVLLFRHPAFYIFGCAVHCDD